MLLLNIPFILDIIKSVYLNTQRSNMCIDTVAINIPLLLYLSIKIAPMYATKISNNIRIIYFGSP